MSCPTHVPQQGLCRWEGVSLLAYKESGSPFCDVTRQVLFAGAEGLGVDLRYFEVGPGGHSTLEQHQHEHLVLVLRGRGSCLVGTQVLALGTNDLVHVPPLTWHQFRAPDAEPLGFLCMVRSERDRPRLPTEEDLRTLRSLPEVAAFIRT